MRIWANGTALVAILATIVFAVACGSSGGDSQGEDDGIAGDRDARGVATGLAHERPDAPADLVDPFAGTAGDRGQLHPAASVPFGMVKLGPDSLLRSHAGYDYGQSIVRGFSHTRIGGVGCTGAGAQLLFLPIVGPDLVRASPVDKNAEKASPGYYAVRIDGEPSILAELTVTAHAGFHRYTFEGPGERSIFVRLDNPLAAYAGSSWEIDPVTGDLDGWVSGKNVCGYGRYRFYFSARFDPAPERVEAVTGTGDVPNLRLWFDASADGPVQVKVGLSTVDADAARADREREIPGWDFDRTRRAARAAWNDQLGAARVEGDEEQVRLFYTMLYRASLLPTDITTGDGRYRGADGAVHEARGYTRYQGWSLWDTYRTKFPLLFLIDPARSADVARSLVDLYEEGKLDWSGDSEPVPTVRTEHAVAVLLDAYVKGIDVDLARAFPAVLAEMDALETPTPDTALEASFDRWAASRIARALGETETADDLAAASIAYRSVWTGNFAEMGADADTVHARGLYEGTLWQYRWAVPHDLGGLVELDGGPEAFAENLETFFAGELYNHGNEPDIHAPFLFHFAGAPWRSQQIVHAILAESMNQWYGTHAKWAEPYVGPIYRLAPEGYIPEMDDDAGTMAAWYVLAAMGLYPVCVGQPYYVLTAPLFDRVEIRPHGSTAAFVVVADGASSGLPFVRSATLNGEPLTRAWLAHDEVAGGGALVLTMGAEPDPAWGADPAESPPVGGYAGY